MGKSAIALLVVSLAATAAGLAHATAPGTNGRVAFAAYLDATDARHSALVTRTGRARVTSRSRSGEHIVFTRAGGPFGDETLFVANANGTGERRISAFDSTCCPWATRDGSRIVFGGSGQGGRVTAATANLYGKNRVTLPLPKGTLNLGPGPFSPDGKVIAREGFDEKHPRAAGVYLTRVSDGKVVGRVTRTHFIPGDFSPTGKQLVLFKGPDGEPPPPGSLWIVNRDGTRLRRVTPATMRVECCFNYRWSPDGKKILFADAEGVLWTIDPNGRTLTRVFKDGSGRYAATPTWSPDGSMILFALDPTPNPFDHPPNALYVIRADGTGLAKVMGGRNFKREPIWVAG
jgi:Tol biopolymer transport system component